MDDVDEKILEALRKNSRAPYKEIAKLVRISDVAVHKRIKKLDEGVIKAFTVLIDQREYGKETTALISLRCEVGKTASIARSLAKIKDVMEVYTALGEYDIVIKIRTKDTRSLREIVEKQLTRIKGINEIRASIVFDCVKEDVSLVM
ncbi:MAG: Lrp/AsnC family transcriptional regulator [Candidatus Hydrothermarchaeaceae archaeon]